MWGWRVHNAVGIHHSGQPMRNDEDGVLFHEPVQGLLNHCLAVRIQGACCLASSNHLRSMVYYGTLQNASLRMATPRLVEALKDAAPERVLLLACNPAA